MTEKAGNEKKSYRPFLIIVLAGAAFFLSVLFLVSPEASSRKTAIEEPPSTEPATVQAPSGQDAANTRSKRYDFRISSSDTFYHILSVLDVPGKDIQEIARKAKPIHDVTRLKKDSVLRAFTTDGKLDRLEYKFNDYSILLVEGDGSGGYKVSKSELPHEVKEVRYSGSIENSLFEDGVKAGADPHAIMALTDIFAWDVDFASDIKKGDTFSILSEVLFVEGQPVRTEKVIGAEMVNDGKKFTAFYYGGKDGGSYYDAEGRSLKRTLLKSPLRFRRITSYFSKARFHPILKQYRPHHGVDYAAPTGTPIESAGSGKIVYAGWKGGYGNYVEIRHSNGYSTAYGHLSKIGGGVRTGSKIEQGQVIGFVGSTGRSTGPHLHYEVRQGNSLINPLSVKAYAENAISKKERPRFIAFKDEVTKKLSGSVEVAKVSGPAAR